MTTLKDISLSELAKAGKNYGFVKSGVNKGKGEYVDPFTLGTAYPIEVIGEVITEHPTKGYKQLELAVSIIKDDNALQTGGKVWLDLPLPTEEEAAEMTEIEAMIAKNKMTAEEEASLVTASPAFTRMQKSGDRFLKFLRAIAPEQFSVFAEIDKSNPKKWVYLDFGGNTMSEKVREKRAAEIGGAVVGFAEGLNVGTQTVVGSQCMMEKKANPNNAKYPFINFYAVKS